MVKKVVSLGLALVMVASVVCITAFAKGDDAVVVSDERLSRGLSVDEETSGVVTEYDGVIYEIIEGDQDPYMGVARDNYVAVNQSLTDSTGSQTISFKTTSDYPYYRIYVSNTSKVTYNITLTNESGVNQLKDSPVVLSSGRSTILINENAASGMRYLTVTAKDGSALSGSVSVRLASSADELE